MATADGRSPLRPRQLHDLRLPPTADDPRPTFVWSAEPPRDGGDLTRGTPYPRLLWNGEGVECTVKDAGEHAARAAAGWVEQPPVVEAVDPVTALQAELEALSPEDRAQVLEAQRQQRLQTLQEKIARLPDASLETLLADARDQASGRGPGRPRKGSSAA
jgi:hypothetical protein